MTRASRALPVVALALAGLVGAWLRPVLATDSVVRMIDRTKLEISTGTATLNTASAVWTSFQPLLTIEPNSVYCAYDVKVVFDLAKATTGFAATYTSETIQFSVQRKVDGSNWRTADNKTTTAISGTNSSGMSIELDLGVVNPTEGIRIVAKLSAENNNNVVFPYVLYYRSGERGTVTPAS